MSVESVDFRNDVAPNTEADSLPFTSALASELRLSDGAFDRTFTIYLSASDNVSSKDFKANVYYFSSSTSC